MSTAPVPIRISSPKVCGRCGKRSKVTDSRSVPSLRAHRRHYVCKCGHEWTTYETSLHPSLIEHALESNGTRPSREIVTRNVPGRTVLTKP